MIRNLRFVLAVVGVVAFAATAHATTCSIQPSPYYSSYSLLPAGNKVLYFDDNNGNSHTSKQTWVGLNFPARKPIPRTRSRP